MVEIVFPQINLSNIKGVLIDLDDTLYDYESAHQASLIKLYEHYKKLIDLSSNFEQFKTQYRLFRDITTFELIPNGNCRSRLLSFQLWFEASKIPLPYSMALKFEEYYWEGLMEAAKVSTSGLEFLYQCQKSKVPVCIVTDLTAQQQMKKIKSLNIENLISAMVTSEEAGVEKPHTRMFQLALEKLNVSPSEAIMVGDHLKKDIHGAEQLGIKGYQVFREN